jgi:RNA polymerase sigma-70 factor (ECF subfamily)
MATDDAPGRGAIGHGGGGGERPATRAPAVHVLLVSERARLLLYIERHLPPALRATLQAADVLQDVYVEAFRRIEQFDARDATSVFRWLVTIARCHMVTLLRRHRAQKRGGSGRSAYAAGGDSLVLFLSELADGRRSPSRSAAAHEFAVVVERAIERLGESYRLAIRLRYVDGLTPPEAAQRMGKTVAAVHMLCQRGLQAIRQDLRSSALYI